MLLSTNIGFLAISSIDKPSPNKSVAQILSYISTILSLFVLIVCNILSNHHQLPVQSGGRVGAAVSTGSDS